jgi:Reverse transcriptase (RNA-dependent DNA polymerase)
METLLFMLKNDLIVYQTYKIKTDKSDFKKLESEILDMKKIPIPDFENISILERRLELLRDEQLKAELEKYSTFSTVNAEKPTPRFLSLAKGAKQESNLSLIRDGNGQAFENEEERSAYIFNYNKSSFYVQGEKNRNMEGLIENFLGEEILNSSIVKNSKLTEEEMMDTNFTVNELDEAIKDVNLKSAGGLDGINYAVIKKAWKHIRTPLCNYANFCVNKGELTSSFKGSVIRLIPKKGDLSNITNWQPISLLNCIYKIVTKSINNRLKKIANRVLSRSQKGFVPNRYIQECIINLVETMHYCEKN